MIPPHVILWKSNTHSSGLLSVGFPCTHPSPWHGIKDTILMNASSSFIPGENPRIIEHPMDTTVPKNDPFTFNCQAEGNPTPTIQWFKDGRELKTDTGSHRIMLPAGGLFFLKVCIITNQLIPYRLYHYGPYSCRRRWQRRRMRRGIPLFGFPGRVLLLESHVKRNICA